MILISTFSLLLSCNTNQSNLTTKKVIKYKYQKKSNNTFTPYNKVISSDTLLKHPLASDSILPDSSNNHLQETARKLDIRYFKKSFNLHRKTYITCAVLYYKKDA